MDIDRAASGIRAIRPCTACGHCPRTQLASPVRFIPDEETWDGGDFFRARIQPRLKVFCTRRIVELARLERWTNLQFNVMDEWPAFRSPFGGPGLDYLAPKWPPATWYRESPYLKANIPELVQRLIREPHPEYVPAHQVLMDVGEGAVPHLLPLIGSESPEVRKRAARILAVIHNRFKELPPETTSKLADLLADDRDFRWALEG